MPLPRRKHEQKAESQPVAEAGEGIAEEAAEFGIEAAFEGLTRLAMSAGEAVIDAAGSVAETAVDVVADVAGSALDGL